MKHYSIRTEQACVDWIKRFIWFQGKRHPKEMGGLRAVGPQIAGLIALAGQVLTPQFRL